MNSRCASGAGMFGSREVCLGRVFSWFNINECRSSPTNFHRPATTGARSLGMKIPTAPAGMASPNPSFELRNSAHFIPQFLTPRMNVIIACVATVPAVMGAMSIRSMRRNEFVLVAPVRGWIVAAWARTLAPKNRHRFQKLSLLDQGTQFDGENAKVVLATFMGLDILRY